MAHRSGHNRGRRPILMFGGVWFLWLAGATHDVSAQEVPAEDATETRQAVIIVQGAPGTAEYGQQLAAWADRLQSAAIAGNARSVLIGGSLSTAATADSDGDVVSDRDQLRQALSELAAVNTPEPLWLVLLGHGSFDGRTPRFSLSGPDISAEELAGMCEGGSRPLAVIACFSCSAPFLNALSGENRVVITATKDGAQVQWSRFGDAFTAALVTADSDIDRDGQTSLLEAWLYASRRTADYYTGEGRLATEHSLLDDNGDARGTRGELYDGFRPADNVENPDQIDGQLARRWHLVRSEAERRLTPEQRTQRDELEAQLESLKKRRSELSESDYLSELEAILLKLASIYEAADTEPEADDAQADDGR